MVAAALLTSCVYDDYAEEELPDGGDRRTVWLSLHTGIVGAPTRAGEDGTPDIERMHSLRVVLLDADGKVEYNGYVDASLRPELFETGAGADAAGVNKLDYSQYRLIRTTAGKKKIFLIANEGSVAAVEGVTDYEGQSLSAFLSNQTEGTSDFENLIGGLYFTPDYTKNIVLSSVYEFEVGEKDLGRRIEKDFWLVRAATKFEFRFENYRGSAVQIEELKISSIADDMYLMAHVGEKDQTKTLPDKTEKYYWIDWLKEVAKDTTAKPENPENENINKDYGWITDYSLPNESNTIAAPHQEKTIVDKTHNIRGDWTISAATTNNTANNLTPGKLEGLPAVYFPESKNLYTKTNANDTWSYTQKYTLTIQVTDTGLSSDENAEYTFEDIELDKLGALFRNTHVIVTMVFDHKQKEIELNLKIGICPWDAAEISIPPFD